MIAAISVVKSGVPVKRAAEEHGVPRTTLHDRLSGRVVHGTKPGPKPYLRNDEEKTILFSSVLRKCRLWKNKKGYDVYSSVSGR